MFSNQLAKEWKYKWFGYCGAEKEYIGRYYTLEEYVDTTCPPDILERIVFYLNNAPMVMVGGVPASSCGFCEDLVYSAAHRSDGIWVWPDRLSHDVEKHHFCIPNEMVKHILDLNGVPPVKCGVPWEDLPLPRRKSDESEQETISSLNDEMPEEETSKFEQESITDTDPANSYDSRLSESQLAPTDSEKLLFTDLEGNATQVQEIIAEGFEGEYAERVPALIELMHSGEPYHQLLACMMLTSWGYPEGFRQLISWADDHYEVPWNESPVVRDRFCGEDSAFQKLAEAISASQYGLESSEITALRIQSVKSLLSIYPDVLFDNALAMAIYCNAQELLPVIQEDVYRAVDDSFKVLNIGIVVDFDLPLQIASLIGVTRRIDEHKAAVYAQKLITEHSQNHRMLRELIPALGNGSTQETLDLLLQLQKLKEPAIEKALQQALSNRSEIAVSGS
jgi:hypothetical protein